MYGYSGFRHQSNGLSANDNILATVIDYTDKVISEWAHRVETSCIWSYIKMGLYPGVSYDLGNHPSISWLNSGVWVACQARKSSTNDIEGNTGRSRRQLWIPVMMSYVHDIGDITDEGSRACESLIKPLPR